MLRANRAKYQSTEAQTCKKRIEDMVFRLKTARIINSSTLERIETPYTRNRIIMR